MKNDSLSDELIKRQIEQEFILLKNSQNPAPEATIEYLLVLSASNSYLKKKSYKNCVDLEDDFSRIEMAIMIAKKIASLRTGLPLEKIHFNQLLKYGPKIVYNGAKEQNEDLHLALDHLLIDYPKDKFIILDLSSYELNTKGQFKCFKEQLQLENTVVGMITHAYHFPRIARMLGKDAPAYPFKGQVKTFVFLVDRAFASIDALNRIETEIQKIPTYIHKGDLATNPSTDITG